MGNGCRPRKRKYSGCQAYLSEQGEYDPNSSHMVPQVESGNVLFYRPTMVMSMPELVKFHGKSNQGDFVGTYNTKTGDIEADVSYGGYSVAGMVDVRKPTGNFHMTGRENNGQVEAESDGNKLVIIYPKKIEEDK
jgi:hypothetical protein